ncbi:hypothetical protein [Thiolapillus sp.]
MTARIIMVKKILADGSLCRKCREVYERLQRDGLLQHIDHIATADPRNPDSEGMHLAARHQTSRAPFFIVRDKDGNERVYDSFLRFKREVLEARASAGEVALDLAERFPELDYI